MIMVIFGIIKTMRKINQTITKRAMPYDLLFIRHGESESNVIQKLNREGIDHPQAEIIAKRPDWQQRLTEKGVKQAKKAAQWLEKEFGGLDNFDGCYTSAFVRARETASQLGGNKWWVDDRIIERFRGVHGVEDYEQEQLAKLLELRDVSPWYTRPDWGESLQDVFQRYRIFQSSIKRHHADEKVIVVSHGDFIKTARYAIEWMLPEEWHNNYNSQADTLPNCGIVHYSRINPYNPTDIREGMNWVRVIDPVNDTIDSSWRELNLKRSYSADDLAQSVSKIENLL